MATTHWVREWETTRLSLSTEAATLLRSSHGDRITVTRAWGDDEGFDIMPRGVVGSLAIDGDVLMIEPKVDLAVGVHMLREAVERGRSLPELDNVEVETRASGLTVALAHWFARLTAPVVERSLLHRYAERTEVIPAVRGRVEIGPSARRPFVRPELECTFDDFTADITENRTLRSATRVLSMLPSLPASTSLLLRRIDRALGDASPVTPERWERRSIRLDRLSRQYAASLALADWALDHCSPELGRTTESKRFSSFLVSMHDLFEAYVATRLTAELRKSGVLCKEQAGQWIDQERSLVRLRPDLVGVGPSGGRFVLDTKYKAFDEDYKPAEADVYQLVTYCVTGGAKHGWLVYPEASAGQAGRTHNLWGSGLTLHFEPVVVGRGPQALDGSIARLAASIADSLGEEGRLVPLLSPFPRRFSRTAQSIGGHSEQGFRESASDP